MNDLRDSQKPFSPDAVDSCFESMENEASPSEAVTSKSSERISLQTTTSEVSGTGQSQTGESLFDATVDGTGVIFAQTPMLDSPTSGLCPAQQTPAPEPAQRWRLPLFLYVATWVSVYSVGGIRFAVAVMTILTFHELGHYLQARRYRVSASLPYFLPIPVTLFGTMGAIIKMDGRIPSRRALFDIGISGPLAGLVPTLIFCIIGVSTAQVVPLESIEGDVLFKNPPIVQWLSDFTFGQLPYDMTLDMGAIGRAGWFGLFLTTLNLFPIGQLDGGHVFYALLGRRAAALSSGLFFGIVCFVMLTQRYMWIPMLALLYMMNPQHPPTQNDDKPLGTSRTVLGTATLLFLFIGFSANPITELPRHPEPTTIVYHSAKLSDHGAVNIITNSK
ncbi:MAG: site-2 protease family protein [Planctomycetaceae bacterium]|nr:site-2 protease family protein [Planctomycetaceae bacterium]